MGDAAQKALKRSLAEALHIEGRGKKLDERHGERDACDLDMFEAAEKSEAEAEEKRHACRGLADIEGQREAAAGFQKFVIRQSRGAPDQGRAQDRGRNIRCLRPFGVDAEGKVEGMAEQQNTPRPRRLVSRPDPTMM